MNKSEYFKEIDKAIEAAKKDLCTIKETNPEKIRNNQINRRKNILSIPIGSDSIIKELNNTNDLLMVDVTYTMISRIILFNIAWFNATDYYFIKHIIGISHLIFTYLPFLPRYILMHHYNTHRNSFKGFYIGKGFENILQILGMWFGCYYFEGYKLHHRVMHHQDNNEDGLDESSTEAFQRDNLFHFVIYWLKHMTINNFYIIYHALKKKYIFESLLTIIQVLFVLKFVIFKKNLYFLYSFIIPLIVTNIALMFGNWSQHIFVNPENPRINHNLTYNTIGDEKQQEVFNDGYHLIHHENPGTKWFEFPEKFIEQMEGLKKNEDKIYKGLVFADTGFFEIGAAVFTKNYKYLFEKYIHLDKNRKKPINPSEMKKFLKDYLKPIQGTSFISKIFEILMSSIVIISVFFLAF